RVPFVLSEWLVAEIGFGFLSFLESFMKALLNYRTILLVFTFGGFAALAQAQELFFEDFQRFSPTRTFFYNDIGENSFWSYVDEPGAPDLEAVTPNRLTGQSESLDGDNPWVL